MAIPHIYQILNHYTSPRELDPLFGVLDNSANERPDWFEYWPIRKFLLNEELNENAFYGFLSPKFAAKTNMDARAVFEFVRTANSDVEVILLSPSIHKSAYFLNVFIHGDFEHPGLLSTAKMFFERINRQTSLDELVTDSRNTVHSNYIVAKPRFWREWLSITEQLYSMAEAKADQLGVALCTPTSYRGRSNVQMKIFLMERIATWVLVNNKSFTARVHDPFVARTRTYKLPLAIVCDALKIAYVSQNRRQYKDVFLMVRGLQKYLIWQIRIGNVFAIRRVRPYLRMLKSYWANGPQ